MNREQAIAKVRKLLALADPGRGGTEAEQRTASRKAEDLKLRFSLVDDDIVSIEAGSRDPDIVFVSDVEGGGLFQRQPNWHFDIRTGAASSNVKVERYNGPTDWKIEIDLDAQREQRLMSQGFETGGVAQQIRGG